MSKSTAVHDVNSIVQRVKKAMSDQLKLLQLGIGACLIFVIAVAGGGLALYHEIGVLNGKVVSLQRSMEYAKTSIDRTNVLVGGTASGVVGLLRAQAPVEQMLDRIETAVSPKSPRPIGLTPSGMAEIRTFFKLVRKTTEPPQFRLGDKIPAAELKPIPEIVEKIAPQLKGTNFLIAQNGALLVTAGAENLVILIVEPA